MNIQKALVLAAKKNKAIRRKFWPAGICIYHGIDNLMYFFHSECKYTWSISELKATDFVLDKTVPYHGPLAVKR